MAGGVPDTYQRTGDSRESSLVCELMGHPLGPPEMFAGILQGVAILNEQVKVRVKCISIVPLL